MCDEVVGCDGSGRFLNVCVQIECLTSKLQTLGLRELDRYAICATTERLIGFAKLTPLAATLQHLVGCHDV